MSSLNTKEHEVGFVVEAKQYVLTLEGLPSAKINDLIVHEKGGRAIIQSLMGDRLLALSLEPGQPRAGDRYTFLPSEQLYSIGEQLFGRMINVLGEPVDGGTPLPVANASLELDVDAPGIEAREPIKNQLYTGLTLIDTLLPIAKGQRQLLFGAVRGGKTQFLTDIVLNQEAYGTICIYAVIGKSLSELERIMSRILGNRVRGKNILIAALSDQPSPSIMLAPSVAMLIADTFQRQGHDVLVVLDDLDMHAKYLREIALLENRLPGRESYPGDLFYQHAHLLERSGQFGKALGGGSISVLPVIDSDPYTTLGTVSTNLMSCTDGHYSFVPSLQAEGIYPAISEEQSITRIGRNCQGLLQKQLSIQLRTNLEAARRERQYSQFGAQVSKSVETTLHQGDLIDQLLRQEPSEHITAEVQVPLMALALTPFLIEKDVAFVRRNRTKLIAALMTSPELHDVTAPALTQMPLAKYLPLVESKRAFFESVCQK